MKSSIARVLASAGLPVAAVCLTALGSLQLPKTSSTSLAATQMSIDASQSAREASAGGCIGVSFAQPAGSPIGVGINPASLAAGDFNLDGKPDLAVANDRSFNVTILLGNSSGGFSEPAGSPFGAGTVPVSVAVGDFNLDGKPDLAVVNFASSNVTILLGDGSGGFTQPPGSPVNVGAFPRCVAIGDFNLDGKPDLAASNVGSSNVTILLGNGSGGFTQAAGSPIATGDFAFFVAVGDFNLDGKPDLAVANQGSGNVTILLGDGSGGFTQPAGSPVGAGGLPQCVAIGDFNQDGKPDLVVANNTTHNVTILLGNGSGGFTQPAGSPVGTGNSPFSIGVRDLNLDGKPDLAVVNSNSSNVTILLGNGSGGFTQPAGSPLSVGPDPESVAVEDFNLDGKPDLAVSNFASNNVTIYLNTCAAFPCPNIAFEQPPGSPFAAGPHAIHAAVGDFNLDGRPDVATVNSLAHTVTILLGNGSGGFTQSAGSPVAAGPTPGYVAVGDFNRDAKPDLAVANLTSSSVTILLGNGIGGFTQSAASPVGTGRTPRSIAIGDFNQDGKPDLATSNAGSANVTILLGDGSGGFTQPAGSPFAAGLSTFSVAVGDFNLDGNPDVAAANQESNTVTILLGDGIGGFTQAAGSPVGVGSSPQSLAVGDFNQDGKPDLAVANAGTSNVTILLGNGSGGFTQALGSPVGAGTSPVYVAVGDFNLDGKPDLGVANVNSGNVTILLGNGSGGFTQPAGSPVNANFSPQCVLIGDFNLDGKPDFAASNAFANPIPHNLTIQLNTCIGGGPPAPPTITCPGNVNSVTAASCPVFTSSVVTYPNPTVSPGATFTCNPPSGSIFSVGCTTVTCIATDAAGNQSAPCTFLVCVFSFCLQDDNNPGNVVLVNSQTGDYISCCNGFFAASGRGTLTARGCIGTIDDNKGNRRVHIAWDTSAFGNRGRGTAFIQSGPANTKCQITDTNMSNNTCNCSTQPPAAALEVK